MKMVGNEFNLTEEERDILEKASQILMDITDDYDEEKFNDCFFEGECDHNYENVVDAFDSLSKFLTVYDYWRNWYD